jgi:hypothetical protein
MIEGDRKIYQDLAKTYFDNSNVFSVNKFVDASVNSLGSILKDKDIAGLDLLSLYIDGLDYEIFESLDVNPKVICVEVNAGWLQP